MATALVTGANRGIGLEFCRQLKARGDEVIGVCRQASQDLKDLGVRIEEGINVADPKSVEDLAARISGMKVDALINNAGVMNNEVIGELDFASIEKQFEVNALGPLRVVDRLLPHLANPAKVALITSRMGSIADNTSGGRYGYRMSKAALNMAGVSLAHDLKDRGVSVAILHPGFVKTDMTGNSGNMLPEEAVQGLLQRIDELGPQNSGTFWHSNGETLPW